MAETLQGFQPDRMLNMIWTILAGWIIWPILCAVIGAGRDQTKKGFMLGLVWGPIGLIIILASKRKYECPTCGCQTLSADLHGRLIASPAAPPPVALPAIMAESESTVQDRRRNATTATPSSVPTGPAKSVMEEACAGYTAEESARLLAWVNQQADALGLKSPTVATAGTSSS